MKSAKLSRLNPFPYLLVMNTILSEQLGGYTEFLSFIFDNLDLLVLGNLWIDVLLCSDLTNSNYILSISLGSVFSIFFIRITKLY